MNTTGVGASVLEERGSMNRLRNTLLGRSILPLTVLALASCVSTRVELRVSRHTSVTLTDARADAILADATLVLGTDDGSGDVACAVQLVRESSAPVTTFTMGTGIINSNADFTAVNTLPGSVKLVNQINWCGGPGIGIIGCAPVPGNSLVVVRFTGNQEGILWGHEFGHNQGLSHRNGLDLVMHPSIATTRRKINSLECNAYRSN